MPCPIFYFPGEIAVQWSLLFFFNSAALGVGLTMDAFSVSMVNGLSEPDMSRRKSAAVAGTFAFFQALMPMTGWWCVRTAAQRFAAFRPYIPWIALILLLYIGGSMLREGLRDGSCDEKCAAVTPRGLFIQGIATSIDALSVGFTIAEYQWPQALACSLIIAALTYVICAAGIVIGRRIGARLSGRASVLGGIILIAIGAEIFISGI
jgi:putative Mn2+ efflux pump MntP